MKLILAILLVWTHLALADSHLRIVRHDKDVVVPQGSVLITNIVALAESASVDSTAYAVTPSAWQQVLDSDSFVLVSFDPPASVSLIAGSNDRHKVMVKQILVPLPEKHEPAHIFVKTGTQTLGLTKYSPKPLKRIIRDPLIAIVLKHPYFQSKEDLD